MDIGSVASAFVFGALSFVSPCVLPLLPGYLSLMSGYSVADLQEGKASTRRMVQVTLLFVLGFTLVFVAGGAAATSIGRFLTRNQSITTLVAGWLIVIFGVIMVALVISNSKALSFLNRERRLEVRPSRLGGWAPPVMGVAFGFGWTPCIGPILGAILTLAASQETVGQGMFLLFVYSMGLGVPFITSGIGLAKLFGSLKFLRRHLKVINVTSGLLMVAFGFLFITGRITELSGFFTDLFIRFGWDRLAEI